MVCHGSGTDSALGLRRSVIVGVLLCRILCEVNGMTVCYDDEQRKKVVELSLGTCTKAPT